MSDHRYFRCYALKMLLDSHTRMTRFCQTTGGSEMSDHRYFRRYALKMLLDSHTRMTRFCQMTGGSEMSDHRYFRCYALKMLLDSHTRMTRFFDTLFSETLEATFPQHFQLSTFNFPLKKTAAPKNETAELK